MNLSQFDEGVSIAMDLLQFLEKNLNRILTVPVIISLMHFILLLIQSLSDGILTNEELHALIQGTSGINIVILGFVMIVLKLKSES